MRLSKMAWLAFPAILLVNSIFSQSLPDSTIKKIDSLFTKWTNVNSPGCAVGIVRNDSLIFAKGYGMANLEYGVQNSPQTIFHMASVSKQFTAFSIVLLSRQGKLGLDDDVRKYLPWFPDLQQKITIRNLLNHTSGIRDQWQLLAISGTRLDDVITQDQIIKVLSKQNALNFSPGEKYSYSNSGFTMLAEIVKSTSGQTLRRFTDSAIFKPLGMTNTHFHDDYTEIVKDRAYSYQRSGNIHFTNSILSYSNVGATSLFTNVTDMSKWVMNFYDHKLGDQKDIDLLTQKAKLNNGQELTYALGIVSDTYKGWRRYSHSGGDAGYRTHVVVFPDLKMGFIVFSNLGDFNPGGKVYEMADLFIKDTVTQKDPLKKGPRDRATAVLIDTISVMKFMGDYISDEGLPFHFELRNRLLYYQIFDENSYLIKELKDTFSIAQQPEVKFVFGIKARDTTADLFTPDENYHLKKYTKDKAKTDSELKAYTGIYYCPELDCRYSMILKDHHLILSNAKYEDVKLSMINEDHLTNENWWMNHLEMIRDLNHKIIGFEVNSGRTMHLRFNKVE